MKLSRIYHKLAAAGLRLQIELHFRGYRKLPLNKIHMYAGRYREHKKLAKV